MVTGTPKANGMKGFHPPCIRRTATVLLVNMKEIRLCRLARFIQPALLLIALSALAFSQTGAGSKPQTGSNALSQAGSSTSQTAGAPDPHAVPALDGGLGPCSADFTITADAAGAPVYAATVKVHIAYGFMNVRKLDLQVSTNIDGKARFTGLPDRLKHGVYFHASEGDRTGEAFDDPANTCKAQFTIVLEKKE